MRCSDGLQGGTQSGIIGSYPPLAGGPRPETHRLRDGAVPGYRRQIHHCVRGAGRVPPGTGALRGAAQPGPRQVETPSEDLLAPWADQICQWLTGHRLQLTRIHELLAERDCRVSYASLQRFVARRTVWALRSAGIFQALLRLGHLRADVGGRHRRAGVGLVGLLRGHPQVPGHRQLPTRGGDGGPAASRLHQGFPGVPPAPRLHRRLGQGAPSQGQAQSGAWRPLCRERFLKGGEFRDLADVRERARRWCRDVAGLRIHGTTRRKPLVVFQDEERETLLPWDGEACEIADWREAKVHQDHHIQCRQALYSVPSSLCPPGQKVEVRVDSKLVRIYHPSTGSGRSADQDPCPPAQGRPCHRPRGLPRRAFRLHHQDPRPHQEQGSRGGAGCGRIRRPAVRRSAPVGQDQAGAQAAAPRRAPHGPAPGRHLPRALDVDLIDVRRLERILVQALEHRRPPLNCQRHCPEGRFARPGSVFAQSNQYRRTA